MALLWQCDETNGCLWNHMRCFKMVGAVVFLVNRLNIKVNYTDKSSPDCSARALIVKPSAQNWGMWSGLHNTSAAWTAKHEKQMGVSHVEVMSVGVMCFHSSPRSMLFTLSTVLGTDRPSSYCQAITIKGHGEDMQKLFQLVMTASSLLSLSFSYPTWRHRWVPGRQVPSGRCVP